MARLPMALAFKDEPEKVKTRALEPLPVKLDKLCPAKSPAKEENLSMAELTGSEKTNVTVAGAVILALYKTGVAASAVKAPNDNPSVTMAVRNAPVLSAAGHRVKIFVIFLLFIE